MVYPILKKMKWIYIKEAPIEKGRKTKVFLVNSMGENSFLGLIKWYSHWRKYCFFPAEQTIFEWDCLCDIAEFCKEQTKEYKINWYKS